MNLLVEVFLVRIFSFLQSVWTHCGWKWPKSEFSQSDLFTLTVLWPVPDISVNRPWHQVYNKRAAKQQKRSFKAWKIKKIVVQAFISQIVCVSHVSMLSGRKNTWILIWHRCHIGRNQVRTWFNVISAVHCHKKKQIRVTYEQNKSDLGHGVNAAFVTSGLLEQHEVVLNGHLCFSKITAYLFYRK